LFFILDCIFSYFLGILAILKQNTLKLSATVMEQV
jgi:hypothetical protein